MTMSLLLGFTYVHIHYILGNGPKEVGIYLEILLQVSMRNCVTMINPQSFTPSSFSIRQSFQFKSFQHQKSCDSPSNLKQAAPTEWLRKASSWTASRFVL